MSIFNIIGMAGGLGLFLYGMTILSSGLEKASGGLMEKVLAKMTGNVFSGILFGALVTAAVQSSSATTVIVVGLVNAGLLKLKGAVGIIMGANIGTTMTTQILRLTNLEGDSSGPAILQLCKPSNFSSILIVIGLIIIMVGKKNKTKNVGEIMMGIGILFTGMILMQEKIAPLAELPQFEQLFAVLKNPVLGVLVGAVVATVIAQLFAALYCLRAVLHVKVIHLKKEYFRLNPEIAKRLLGLGTPVAAQNVIIAVGGMVVQSVVNRYGTLFVAGFTATNKLYGILEIAAVSFGYAVTTYVGQNLGAGLLDRVKKGMHSATWIALLTSVVITVFVLIFGKYGIALFISGTAEEVSISSQVAIHYLNIMSICLSILYMLHIYRSALMGLGDTIMPMASGIMEFLMRIGVALFLPLIIGQEGIFYAEVTAWTGAAILLVTTYFLRMHKLTRELDTSQSKAGE